MNPSTTRAKPFDRIFEGVGRIQNSSGVRVVDRRSRKDFDQRDAILTQLHANGQLEVLRAFKTGDITIQQLVEIGRERSLKEAGLLANIKLRTRLWCAVDQILPRMGKSAQTRRRYQTSLAKLRMSGVLAEDACVSDLGNVDWRGLREEWWEGSAADWNHLGRALSRFLTLHLSKRASGVARDGKYHPFRLDVMDAFEREDEGEGRVPEITPAQFWNLVLKTPEHAQPCYVGLVVTGLRVGEYVQVTRAHHNEDACAVKIPNGKTGYRTIRYSPLLRDWMSRAIPSPLQYRWMREYFVRARDELQLDIRLHDLRHLHGQWASDAGLSDSAIGDSLGHSDPRTTRRYTRQTNRGQVAAAVGRALTVTSTMKEVG